MKITVYDLEGDGFYEDVTQVWCGCCSDLQGSERRAYNYENINSLLDDLLSSDIIICHNQYDYDLRVLEKLYRFRYKGIAVDTLIMSRLIRPQQMGGEYSLDAYGRLFGVPKPKHEDWTQYSPEMLHRCEQDVEINRKAFHWLLKQGGLTVDDIKELPRY